QGARFDICLNTVDTLERESGKRPEFIAAATPVQVGVAQILFLTVVAYGPGLHMLRADTSPVQDRLKRLKELAFPGKIQFSACNNTKQNMEKAEGREISVVPDATIVPSGVVQLMELQEQGWSYVRP